jgi:hypothetical protein
MHRPWSLSWFVYEWILPPHEYARACTNICMNFLTMNRLPVSEWRPYSSWIYMYIYIYTCHIHTCVHMYFTILLRKAHSHSQHCASHLHTQPVLLQGMCVHLSAANVYSYIQYEFCTGQLTCMDNLRCLSCCRESTALWNCDKPPGPRGYVGRGSIKDVFW